MQFGKNSKAYFSPELERDLIELMNLREMIEFRPEITMGPIARFTREEKIGEWFKKAREIANKYQPQSFAVSVGIPFGAQVSFTWQT